MAFSLELLRKIAGDRDTGANAILGAIEAGRLKEHFVTSLMYWSVGDYLRQWREGLERITQHAATKKAGFGRARRSRNSFRFCDHTTD